MKKDGFSSVHLKLYPKMRHEILNEEVKQQVFEEIKNWLDEQQSS